MKDGKCVKCKSGDVYMTDNGVENSVGISSRERANLLFSTYICLNCGYTESYMNFDPPDALTENISNEKRRAKFVEMYRTRYGEQVELIRENWKKVGW